MAKLLFAMMILIGLTACDNGKNSTIEKLNSQTPIQTVQEKPIDKPIKLYFIGFDIQFATGQHENDVEKFVKNNSCQLTLVDFKTTLDNDFSQTETRMTYDSKNVRAKFLIDNQAYYIDYDGILSQPIDTFKHSNKEKLSKLVATKCH